MLSQYKRYPLGSGLCLFLLSLTAVAQDSGSNFRNRVHAAFEQDVPVDQDVSEEYRKRMEEARDPNLDTDIPEFSSRELGPRITVKKIRFHRLEEYPEFGITKDALEELAESLRVKFMREDEIVAAGFTQENLKELALLLDNMGARYGSEGLGPQQLRRLVTTVERQNAERGLTYADLEEIAAELTRFYREQGLFLAQVQIPAQEVQDGIVTFSVREGILGQISVTGNERYSESRLSQPFQSQLGELVNHEDVEESLYLLNDLPSLNINGYFSPGDNPGETRLNLKVRDASSWQIVSRYDNHGSTFTGDQRMYTSFDWGNPLGIGDELTLAYLKSTDGKSLGGDLGADLGQFRYSLPIFGARTRLQFTADYNKFSLHDSSDENSAINGLDIHGTNESYGISADHKFIRSREFNVSGTFGVTQKASEIEARISLPDSGDDVSGVQMGLYLDRLSDGVIPMLNVVNTRFQYGDFNNEVDLERDTEFYKFAADTSSLLFIPSLLTDNKSRLIIKTRSQYSESALPSFEQFSLGGANGVRAFDVRDFSADQAAVVSAEWYPDMPSILNPTVFDGRLSDILQMAVIADAGYGVVNNYERDIFGDGEVIPNDWAALSGAGLLFKLNWKESWSGQVSVAWPTMSISSIDGTGDDADAPTVYADFTYFLY
ncbi:ShlB/FhaC/HecB family hemolysin secretion/activation protein [uncultured Microbulbifer sp.]|uniref:ShlB/FhaC/HecB family hemolysin secretion/activation protein n=1 Tax=uncultured Microbulbifer sp. TaxID=348147 RepID=UPI00262B2662|nr:ShlB/FhaC/HecB family hemolysin secretion/activation protein [uncultured Microbulbifer sp.]